MKVQSFSPVAIHQCAGLRQGSIYIAVLLSLFFVSAASAGINSDRKNSKSEAAAPNSNETCSVENFGKVNEHYYRGAQPEAEQYEELASLGVKTVIDLRDDAKDFAKAKAETAGLKYVNLPLSDKKYPAEMAIKRFLELANDSQNWPIYVHCAGGRHRTGAMTAIYRMTYEGWDVNRAYEEMKDYDFYTRWGHKSMKTVVFDYWKELQVQRSRQASVEAATSAPAQSK